MVDLLKTLAVVAMLGAVGFAGTAHAEDAPYWLHSEPFAASAPERAARTVPVASLESYLNKEEADTGVTWSVQPCEDALCLDVTDMKGIARPLDVVRGIWISARMVKEDFAEMRLVDGDKVVYRIEWPRIREIGEAFVWREEGHGQNPIHLNRMFADAVRNADGSRATREMNGSLMGDTFIAVKFIGEDLVLKYAFSAFKG